jgi:type IV secretion system protein VirB1
MLDVLLLAQQCAPDIHLDTMRRIVHVESSFNPYAIGVVGSRLERQPRNREEAIATAHWLDRNGHNYSVGLAQVNRANFARYGLTLQTAFDACPNLRAGGEIIKDCFVRANKFRRDEQAALRDAFSCYYSGNFVTGYKQGYVIRIVGAGATLPKSVRAASDVGSEKKNNIVRGNRSPAKGARDDAPGTVPETSGSALLF